MISLLAFFIGEPTVPLHPEHAVVLSVELEALALVAGAGPAELLALAAGVEELALSSSIAAHTPLLKVSTFEIDLLYLFLIILLLSPHDPL
jgi:hypothetical protein